MADSSIEWTEKTWNPTVGCTKVSAGCKHCYAETMHGRLTKMGQRKYAEPFETVRPYPEHLAEPLKWKKPQRIFVNSMSDLFHEDVPDEYIDQVLAVMLLGYQHTYQVLTKRAERLPLYFSDPGLYRRVLDAANRIRRYRPELSQVGISDPAKFPAKWIWLGVSVENQEQADARIPHLLGTPAAVRFLSCEPMLSAVNLRGALGNLEPRVHWVITGGESGPGARPCNVEWIRSIVRQCKAANVPVFVKQLGSHPESGGQVYTLKGKGGDWTTWADDLRIREFPHAP